MRFIKEHGEEDDDFARENPGCIIYTYIYISSNVEISFSFLRNVQSSRNLLAARDYVA